MDTSKTRTQMWFLPDVQAWEVSPGEYVVSSEHHPDVGHQDVLHTSTHLTRPRGGCKGGTGAGLTLIQPMMEVVSAELYCVHSRMEYIRTKLRHRESNHTRAETTPETPKVPRFTPWCRRGQTAPQRSDPATRCTPGPVANTAEPQHRGCQRASTHARAEEAYHVEVTGVVGVQRGRQNHDQGVVVEEPVFTQLLQGGINQDCHSASDEHSGAVLTLESSFCFTYAPLAAVRTLFSIMKA